MTDDQQRARELRKQAAEILAAAYKDAHFFGAMDDALSDTPSPHCQVTITAITAALRAAPEGVVLVPVEPTQEMLDMVCTADGFEPWTDKTMGDVYRTMLAARPQGVKDGN